MKKKVIPLGVAHFITFESAFIKTSTKENDQLKDAPVIEFNCKDYEPQQNI